MSELNQEKTVGTLSELGKKISEKNSAVLEDLFSIGYTTSNHYTIYKDEESGKEISVQFRTLLPSEIRDVSEIVNRYESPVAKMMTEALETLARAIVKLNGMPLILPNSEMEEYQKRTGKMPSMLDMARIILIEKVKSEHVVDALYEAYQEFAQSIVTHFQDVKKKLKTQTSSV